MKVFGGISVLFKVKMLFLLYLDQGPYGKDMSQAEQ